MRRLAILSDYGLDDAVATAHIFERRTSFGPIDVLAVAGNVSADNSLLNARKLLSHIRADKTGVRIVDTGAVTQNWTHLPSIHGNDGMGDLLELEPSDVPVISYAEWLADAEDFTILSLGPLTVTLDILKKKGPRPLMIMAGLTEAEPNFKGYEFNHELDKEAFSAAVKFPHAIATLDTCRAEKFNMIGMRGKVSGLKGALIDRAIELAAARHPDNCYIYDYVAAQALTDPSAFVCAEHTDPWGNRLNELKGK